MKNLVYYLSIVFFCVSCQPKEEKAPLVPKSEEKVDTVVTPTGLDKFWEALSAYCGKAFEGELVSAPANDDFAGKKLVMHLLSCNDEFILIPFNVGENRSRTWILRRDGDRVELKHDHRNEDGSDDEITMYGGTSTNSGLPHIQVFPADQQTLEMIPAAATNIWWITLKDNVYTYNLRRAGSDREFSVAFDLSKEVEIPEPSWGWEEGI
ncbi:MAG TPA: hypothetical protein VFD80_01105 [Flavobacteriaceae bacterium]|nr:hypothetical protein [Flavobacteriaceae bacterium]